LQRVVNQAGEEAVAERGEREVQLDVFGRLDDERLTLHAAHYTYLSGRGE
jgi:hypothetical protein